MSGQGPELVGTLERDLGYDQAARLFEHVDLPVGALPGQLSAEFNKAASTPVPVGAYDVISVKFVAAAIPSHCAISTRRDSA